VNPQTPIATPSSIALSIAELGEPGYRLLKSIPITIQIEEGAYLASFFEANVHASGDTDQEAYENLRSMVLDTFDSLEKRTDSELATGAQHQRRVLVAYIARVPA